MPRALLQGGRVIDPTSGLDAHCDVLVVDDRIAAIGENLPSAGAAVIDCTGRLVLPGLIDTHAHVYEHVTGRFGLNADLCGVRSGVTTLVDQGGASCMTLAGFRNFVAAPASSVAELPKQYKTVRCFEKDETYQVCILSRPGARLDTTASSRGSGDTACEAGWRRSC